jgi:hypothetical protein
MTACLWCGTGFTPRRPAKFCSNAHRLTFHNACRTYGEREYTAGRVTIEKLRSAASETVHGSGEG